MIDQIDLTLFHREDAPPNANWHRADRLNSWTSLRGCRFLEWMGWYNLDVAQRLLGHYRLFQHFNADYSKSRRDLAASQAYILQYRASHGLKHFFSRVMAFLTTIIERKRFPVEAEIAAINRQLVNDSTSVLYDFLIDADHDFTAAFLQAMRRIKDPSFFNKSVAPPTINLQVNQTDQHYSAHQYNTYTAQVNIQPAIKAGAQGKESGIFSKKQVLILFDMLSAFKDFDSIDYTQPNKFDGYADLLHALTGKSKLSILEELNNYRRKGLYEWHTQGELGQLIITLTHLSNSFRKARFKSFTRLLDKKIIELESHKED